MQSGRKFTDLSEEYSAFIFRAEEYPSEHSTLMGQYIHPTYHLSFTTLRGITSKNIWYHYICVSINICT